MELVAARDEQLDDSWRGLHLDVHEVTDYQRDRHLHMDKQQQHGQRRAGLDDFR